MSLALAVFLGHLILHLLLRGVQTRRLQLARLSICQEEIDNAIFV